MKIFLTEINAYGTTFAGPNIIAKTIERAEQAATHNGLVVVGVLDSIYLMIVRATHEHGRIKRGEDSTLMAVNEAGNYTKPTMRKRCLLRLKQEPKVVKLVSGLHVRHRC
jgi:hypothetical protein